MIASGLKAAGFNTGLYTSPHLHTFTERIQLNGENISRPDFADLIDHLWPYAEAIEKAGDLGVVSVFEMLTAMAFVHFRDHADIAVVETGLGGRLDATNVVIPEVAVITSISRDHVRILGDKISQIAREKAGIIKPGVPTVVAKNHPVTWRVMRERASEVGSETISACATSTVSDIDSELDEDRRQRFVMKRWKPPRHHNGDPVADGTTLALEPLPDPGLADVNICTKLLGAHQIDNARTAATALNVLYRRGHAFDVNAAVRGMSDTKWPCRAEIVDLPSWPLIILDGAHNDASLRALSRTVWCLTSTPYILIVGATEGHDHEMMTRELGSKAVRTIATQSRHPKSVPASRLAKGWEQHGLDFIQRPSVDSALQEASRISNNHTEIGLIIVTGSLFIAAEAREHLLGIEPELYDDLSQPYMVPYDDAEKANDRIA